MPWIKIEPGIFRTTKATVQVIALGLAAFLLSSCGASHRPTSYRESRGTAACKSDCSGHEAGWRWAAAHGLSDENRCGGNNESFREGCRAFVEDHGAMTLRQLPPPTASSQLDDCSPFTSFDGTQELDFDFAKRTITQKGDAVIDGVGGYPDPRLPSTTATFEVNEAARIVTVYWPGGARIYELVVPSDQGQCILAAGETGSTDLRTSWFGVPDPGHGAEPSDTN